MARQLRLQERRTRDIGRAPSLVVQDRMLPARAYRYLGRQPGLMDLPVRRPAYLEMAMTAVVFVFLALIVVRAL
jgi:hypothetical protein